MLSARVGDYRQKESPPEFSAGRVFVRSNPFLSGYRRSCLSHMNFWPVSAAHFESISSINLSINLRDL
jgi:hypothetical protein